VEQKSRNFKTLLFLHAQPALLAAKTQGLHPAPLHAIPPVKFHANAQFTNSLNDFRLI
jgi:hypothetical protein